MAKPSNMGTYNQNLEFPDENSFKKAFEEGRERAKNLAEEAYTKKKSEFLEKFHEDMRYKIMMPPGTNVVMTDPGTGKKRLNKGFYDIATVETEQLLRMAKREAKKMGLSTHHIKEQDIMTPRMNNLFKEAAKRQFEGLAMYKDRNGEAALMDLLQDEGHEFLQFYRRYQDPWAENPSLQEYTHEDFANDVRGRQTRAWYDKKEALGWTFNAKGKVTGMPGALDPKDPLTVYWDKEKERHYVNTAWSGNLMKGFFDVDTWNVFGGGDWLDKWSGSGRKYLD
jgi:hypothetical protein